MAKTDSDVLVVAGPSLVFNPTLDVKDIDAAREADPMAASIPRRCFDRCCR